MSQHDLVIDNGNGLAVRGDINNALQALGSLSAGTSAPSTTYAYQPWYDTTLGLLKIRNAANNAWVTFGPAADATKTEIYAANAKAVEIDSNQNVKFSSTGAIRAPVGTTGQRPTAVQGHIRFNTTNSQFEGYDGANWGAIGGAGNGVLDTFSGNGSTTGFTLTYDPGSENNTIVSISGVLQHKSTYSISGTTLTFSVAPPSGTSNIEVMYNVSLSVGTPSDNTVTYAKLAAALIATSANIIAGTASKVPDAAALAPLFYGTKVYHTTGLSITTATWTALTFDTEAWDDAAWHSTVSNTERIVVDFTGRVRVTACYAPNTTSNANFGIRIRKNGTTIARNFIAFPNSATEAWQLPLSVEVDVVPTDYIDIQVYQSTGSGLTDGTGVSGSSLSVTRIK